jgi:endonuclease III
VRHAPCSSDITNLSASPALLAWLADGLQQRTEEHVMSKTTKKLSLNAETVRNLSSADLEAVNGGQGSLTLVTQATKTIVSSATRLSLIKVCAGQ